MGALVLVHPLRLEVEPSLHFDSTGAEGSSGLAEQRVLVVGNYVGEVRVVKQVEEVGAELKLRILS